MHWHAWRTSPTPHKPTQDLKPRGQEQTVTDYQCAWLFTSYHPRWLFYTFFKPPMERDPARRVCSTPGPGAEARRSLCLHGVTWGAARQERSHPAPGAWRTSPPACQRPLSGTRNLSGPQAVCWEGKGQRAGCGTRQVEQGAGGPSAGLIYNRWWGHSRGRWEHVEMVGCGPVIHLLANYQQAESHWLDSP